ncbi:hypothetical protein FRB95_001161 [Tulasnella sp. JGI-2019a]|nr:hypothetical protein FRB93_002151 [Tulasnella sp. JGI-2019a]KAG9032651.1 hypothetical protein FRB95_001161 [Tulasnella sp. JGI-2019a]
MAKSVNELPEEILGMVFFEFVNQEVEPEQRLSLPFPRRLAGVCHLWKELVEENSELWSRIDVRFTPEERFPRAGKPIKDEIQRAKQSPLALYIHGYRSRGYSPDPLTRDVLALYDLVKDHRWRALSIFNPGHLSSFQPIFRHMLDNPQMCRISFFQMGAVELSYEARKTRTLVQEALRQNLRITDLVVQADLLEPSHPLLQVVPHLQLLQTYNATTVLDCVKEATSLRSLRLSDIHGGLERDDPTPTCTLPELERLDLRACRQFPKLLILKLDLPNIQSLVFKMVNCKVKEGDEQLKSLFWNVSWLRQIESLTLEEVQISEETLLFALRRLPLLTDLTLVSRARVSCRTTKTLSLPPEGRRGWLSPLLEVMRFGDCPRLSESDVMALVEARVRDVPSAASTSTTTEDQPPPTRLRMVIWEGRDMVRRGVNLDG